MASYRTSSNLKSGLVLFAVLIAVASLAYTSRIVDQLRAREQSVIEIWSEALKAITESEAQNINPYTRELADLYQFLQNIPENDAVSLDPQMIASYRNAILWAQGMPPSGETSFIANSILLRREAFTIPSVLSDGDQFISWMHVDIPQTPGPDSDTTRLKARLLEVVSEMDAQNEPIPIIISSDDLGELKQSIHYGESKLIRELRLFPYIQLLFVGLFIVVGYFGFSYVRQSEQQSLWVGMAKEAAHQLGTPISSLLGWVTLLKQDVASSPESAEALTEISHDIDRLSRVANRFSNIGSRPQLVPTNLEPVVEEMVSYIKKRIPGKGETISLTYQGDNHIILPLNAELFQWVIENLLKNALDAMENQPGEIRLTAHKTESNVVIDVQDTGKGMNKRVAREVFRPGFSTKKRGWGLGLSLAKRIIDDYHGGKLEVYRTRPGEGTTFRITMSL